ncbi:MAG: hypothetical protein B6U72_02950 [Candidatus Altiarchaeales archaeon ex4484_2]|nr:MAG: hypothetical protein B6U72_02950 [Candidatus Altiarchaeales archaeon ex4484_2]
MKDIITNLDGIIEKLRNDWDYTIVISGRRRKGKSTLAYHIAEYVSQKLESKIWLCYDYDGEKGLREAMFNSKQFDVIFADETISFLSKNDWNHPHAREFIELFDRSAYKNLLYLFVIPSFSSLMKGFRTDRIDMHLWIPQRGMMKAYVSKDTKEGVYMPDRAIFSDTFPPLPADKEEYYQRVKMERHEETIAKKRREGLVPPGSYLQELIRINARMKGFEKFHLTQTHRAQFFNKTTRQIKNWDKLAKMGAI